MIERGLTGRSRRIGALARTLLLVVAGLLPGCASGRVNLWPFYFQEARQVPTPDGTELVRTVEVLGPIFTWQSDPRSTWHAVRPFYNFERFKNRDVSTLQYLWPFGLYQREGGKLTDLHFFLLFGYQRSLSYATGKFATHAHVLHLMRWGRDDRFGPYFSVFPLAGVTHGVLSDTWSFVLFPLYSHYRQGKYVRNDFPWPILGYASTPEKDRVMYRLFPFFVSQRKNTPTEQRVRYDVLWPFVRWRRLDRHGDSYFTGLAVTGIYSDLKQWDRKGNLLAWRATILGFNFGRDRTEDPKSTGWSVLWSIVKSAQQPKKDEFRIVPFYWRTTWYPEGKDKPERRWTRTRAPWPIIWFDDDRRDPTHLKSSFLVAPFYWRYRDDYVADDGTVTTGWRTTVWPFCTWETGPDGGRHVWVVSRGWKDESKGLKRNYGDLLRIFEHHNQPGGEKETRVLWRLYHSRRTPHGRYLSVACFFTYDSTREVVGEDGPYVSVLLGLVKWRTTEHGRRWRILYIPFGGGPKSEDSDAESP
jgi:hypothetical protein